MTRPFSRHTSDNPPGEEMKYDVMASLTLTHMYTYIYNKKRLNKHVIGYGPRRATTDISHPCTRNTDSQKCTKQDKNDLRSLPI
jgi:hypothetical protein